MTATAEEKAVAYITHGDRLLVFLHPGIPEAGVQVPAGTIQPGEDPAAAALREAREETGLERLHLVRFLGTQKLEHPTEKSFIRRHYFHLRLEGEAPDRWRSYEQQPSDGSPGPIEFEFYWSPYRRDAPSLLGGMDAMLSKLVSDT